MIGRLAGPTPGAAAAWPAVSNHEPVPGVAVFALAGFVFTFALLTVQSWRYARRDREHAAYEAGRASLPGPRNGWREGSLR